MSGKDEGGGLFRRMARKVTAPARELVGLGSRETEARPTEFDKAEMKAMIERKRRNDYVRKRELDSLRRIRREGLSGDQAQALTMQSSRIDEPAETRPTQSSMQSSGIKAKIDAIERQMVGASSGVSAGSPAKPPRAPPALPPGPPPPLLTTTLFEEDGTPTVQVSASLGDDHETVARLDGGPLQGGHLPDTVPFDGHDTIAPTLPASSFENTQPYEHVEPTRPAMLSPLTPAPRPAPPLLTPIQGFATLAPAPEPAHMLAPRPVASPAATMSAPPVTAFPAHPAPVTAAPHATPSAPPVAAREPLMFTSPLPPPAAAPSVAAPATVLAPNPYAAGAPAPRAAAANAQSTVDLGGGERVEVSEVVHDEALDEAVIAFAGGDFQGCERALQALVGVRGERRDHDETWLVLFDLYRAIGQQSKFETVTMEYVERFHRSAPQWFSLPKLLAEATTAPQADGRMAGGIGWVCPATLDADAVTRLDALSMQLPSPWVMDWTALATVDAEGASRLCKLFTSWSTQVIAMQWIAGDRLMSVLHDIAPTGVRDADPVFWMLRLEALRLTHRPDQFDEVAIDYCVTYEVSPPSWENARCKAQLLGTAQNTRTLSLSVVGEATTSFMDTSMISEELSMPSPVQITSVELAGQLAGDLAELLSQLTAQVGQSQVIRISCALLMRVDFVAAGDLLNWVATRHGEGREIVFHETHRLVALMFGAMGINENARVQLRHS